MAAFCNQPLNVGSLKMTEGLQTTQFKRSPNKIESNITSINNISGLKAVKSVLDVRQDQCSPTTCIVEALKLSSEFNSSGFTNKHFLLGDGTV